MHAPPPRPPARTGRRNVAIGAALTVVVAIAASALLLQGNNGVNGETTTGAGQTADAGAGIAGDAGTVSTPESAQSAVATDLDASAEPPPTDAGPGNPPTEPPAPDVEDRPAIDVSPESAIDMALDLLSHFPDDFDSPPPAASTLAAVMDSASAIWRARGVPAKAREVAAYVLATSHAFRRDWRQCVAWSDSAIVLDLAQSGPMDLRSRCHDRIR